MQVWATYKEIERVIYARYGDGRIENSGILIALQRLGESVLYNYKLSPEDHQIKKKYRLKLNHRKMDLSTTELMLNAQITQWQDRIVSEKVGDDAWTKGRPEGYKQKQSLRQKLKLPYSEIKLIVDMQFNEAEQLYTRLDGIVQGEVHRLSSADKKAEINTALRLLKSGIAYKYNVEMKNSAPLSISEKEYVKSSDLYSYNTFLDLKVRKWSLRQALNLSINNPLSWMFGLQEVLWGEAKALENVKKRL